MTVPGDIVAQLGARVRATLGEGGDVAGPFEAVDHFGDNPGGLRMLTYAPGGLAPGAALVVVLHGCGQTAAGYAEGAGWRALADRYGFALLCPEQTRVNNPNLCFNWFNLQDVARGGGEAASIAAMVAHALAEHDLDARRVFVTGLSAGGAMTSALLAAYPDRFAAGAIVAGLPYGVANGMSEALSAMRSVPARSASAWGDKVRGGGGAPARWPRVAIWHGDADTTVGPAAADALVLQWTDVHGVASREEVLAASPGRRHSAWRDADGEIRVEAHRIAGLGHGSPIAAAGPDGCGAAAPWILEAGISSSLEIARSWGLAGARRATPAESPSRAQSPPPAGPPRRTEVGDVIARALKTAGLLR